MKLRSPINISKIIFACVIIFLAQLSCESNVDPKDPRVPITFNNMTITFIDLFDQMQLIPGTDILPPQITQINTNNSETTVDGLGKTYLDIKSGNSSELTTDPATVTPELQTKIRLYHIQSSGCEQQPLRGNLIGETVINNDRTWSIRYNPIPGEVIAATQVSNGKESGLSNLKVNIKTDKILLVQNKEKLENDQYKIPGSEGNIKINGSSYPGACIVLQNQDESIGRVGSATANESGKWQIQVPMQVGENKFKLFIKDLEETKVELSLSAFSPKLQWPYSFSGKISAWYGNNDYHLLEWQDFHNGIDISGGKNESVRTVADGDIFYVRISSASGGNVVFVDHGGWFSAYLHLDSVSLPINGNSKSTKITETIFYDNPIHVLAGQEIGITGNTGCGSCGVHLHFSAFQWVKGDRAKSLAKNKHATWPASFGIPFNLNPPKNTILGNKQNSDDLIQKCVSDFNYWDIDWSSIPILSNSNPSGTKFDTMGKSEKCAIKN